MPYLAIDGTRHYYQVNGAGDPLLLLHGGLCSLETLTAQIDELSASYRVYAPERQGHGRTADGDGPYGFATMTEHTVAFLDGLGIARAHVVGFSDGAIIGLMLAIQHPQRLRSLVAISGCLGPDWYVRRDEPRDAPDAAPSFPAFQQAYERLSPDGPDHYPVVLDKLLTLWRAEPQIDPAALSGIAAPTLVMAGDRDSISTAHTMDIAAAIPGAQLGIVPDAGHMVLNERPTLANRVIGEFLARLPRSPD